MFWFFIFLSCFAMGNLYSNFHLQPDLKQKCFTLWTMLPKLIYQTGKHNRFFPELLRTGEHAANHKLPYEMKHFNIIIISPIFKISQLYLWTRGCEIVCKRLWLPRMLFGEFWDHLRAQEETVPWSKSHPCMATLFVYIPKKVSSYLSPVGVSLEWDSQTSAKHTFLKDKCSDPRKIYF